jgi:pimeloyl-ACP methyl ester carboxylesterase
MPHEFEPIVDAKYQLIDGRNLAYALWGDPDGESVFLFHGAPGSRMFAPDPEITARVGLRLVTVDRPGYGGSDPDPGRSILDWPADVLQLADAIQAPRFAVVAHSSGGAYALACARELTDRVSAVALVSCVAPYDEPTGEDDEDQALTRLARKEPDRAAAQFAESIAFLVDDPEIFLTFPRPEPDVRLLSDERIRTMFISAVREGVRQGTQAYGWDCVLERQAWGFALADIDSRVSIWQGSQDSTVPPSQAVALRNQLPRAHLKNLANDGHGLILARWEEISVDLKVDPYLLSECDALCDRGPSLGELRDG